MGVSSSAANWLPTCDNMATESEEKDGSPPLQQLAPSLAQEAVLIQSQPMPEDSVEVKGYSWDDGPVDYPALLQSYLTSGFQATNFGLAVQQINDMVRRRLVAWACDGRGFDMGVAI